jgi:heptosyltransferase III
MVSASPMRILFVASSRIGDAVLCTGLLDHLLRQYPEARFTVVTGPVAEDVFARMPNRERTIVVDKQRFGMHWLPLWWWSVRHWWRLVVDIRASALAYLVPTRHRAVMRKSGGHKTEQLARILDLAPPPLPVVWTDAADRARAAALLPEGGPGGGPGAGPVIGLGPTANWDGKVWPPERFVELAQRLAAECLPGARIAIFAGPGAKEAALAAPVLAALPEAVDLVGNLTLPEVAACMARCAIFVGNDSGLMHIAAAAGCPTLGLFGPTPAKEYGPAGRCAAPVLSADKTMEGLSVDAAFEAAANLLEKP